MKPEEKWNNTVIEVLDREHGKKVIKWWKWQGLDVNGYDGDRTKEDGCSCIYYGIINGRFDNYPIGHINKHNAKIITLPEPFPEKWYMVCTKENQKVANEWRRQKADYFYSDNKVDIGWYFLSQCPYDSSFYSAGDVPNDTRIKGYCPITFEQFKEYALKQPKQSNKMKITAEQAQQIIDMVSPSCKWKERLLDLWAKNIVLKQEIEVDDSLYKEGYKDASTEQKKVLDGIFEKSKEVEVPDDGIFGFLSNRVGGGYLDISFLLSGAYNWEIKKDSQGCLCLNPTNK